ncbi:MAG TPA: hypothetical protein PLV42_01810 [bacterium]|nr:hypothetical protein [bacterium]
MSEVRTMTDAKLREVGYRALLDRMGVAGFIRFMRQLDAGSGDYTEDRRKLYAGTKVANIVKKIAGSSSKTK